VLSTGGYLTDIAYSALAL